MYRMQYPDDPGMHNNYGNTRGPSRNNATFCERIKASLVAFLAGFVLLGAATGLLFWNEGRAVQTAQSLDEGLSLVLPLRTADVAFEENNGKLVYLSGPLTTDHALKDEDYGVKIYAVKLKRTAEMLQWVETTSVKEKNNDNDATDIQSYSYSMQWEEKLISSSSFDKIGYENPISMPVKSTVFIADPVKLGNFYLSEVLIGKINSFKQLKIDYINLPVERGKSFNNEYVFLSKTPHEPQIGDIRIMWHYAGISGMSAIGEPDDVSVIARQLELKLTKYETVSGDDLEILYEGVLTPEALITHEQLQNNMLTWAVRFGGWLLMFVGFNFLFNIITATVSWIPIIRDLVAMGVFVLNATLSISLSITVIAFGWIRYRPMLGISLLVLALVPLFISKLRRTRSPSGYNRNYHS